MEFKDILKKERIAHGYTQEELGKLVGLKKSAIHKYETGLTVNPGRNLIFKLAQALNVSPCYLLCGEGDQSQTLLDPEQQLLDDFRKLNDTGRSKALEYVHDLTENEKYTKKEGHVTSA